MDATKHEYYPFPLCGAGDLTQSLTRARQLLHMAEFTGQGGRWPAPGPPLPHPLCFAPSVGDGEEWGSHLVPIPRPPLALTPQGPAPYLGPVVPQT